MKNKIKKLLEEYSNENGGTMDNIPKFVEKFYNLIHKPVETTNEEPKKYNNEFNNKCGCIDHPKECTCCDHNNYCE